MSQLTHLAWLPILAITLTTAGEEAASSRDDAAVKWWKGNTHTHTLWSDGNAAPEHVADWYRDHGYNFLVLSDHNRLSTGEQWFPLRDNGHLTPARVDDLKQRFGEDWVVLREKDGRQEMRLKTLDELRGRFEVPGSFMFIQGEEITDSCEDKPVHVNALNLATIDLEGMPVGIVIPPQRGETIQETMQRDIDAVVEHGQRYDRPVLAHVDHPNYDWAITAEHLASIRHQPFFEVFNGHPSVRNYGDKNHPSVEAMWDEAMTTRLTTGGLGVLYGLASDDAHEHYTFRTGLANPGRGWIMVRATEFTPEAIIGAMHRGDFYASTGVVLDDVTCDGTRYAVTIHAAEGVTYTTQFIGTRRTGDGHGEIGRVLAETTANPAVYEFVGDELYVRVKIVSSAPHANPWAAGDRQCAWCQPVSMSGDRPADGDHDDG